MDTLKQRILDYVTANQPATILSISKAISIGRKPLSRELTAMKSAGLLVSAVGLGYFTSREKLNEWRSHPDEDFISERGMMGGFAAARAAHSSGRTRQAQINSALSGGGRMTMSQLCEEIGCDSRQMSTAITKMVKMGELGYEGKVGHRIYYLQEPERYNSVNVIFEECKHSDAHRRMMMVYGRAG